MSASDEQVNYDRDIAIVAVRAACDFLRHDLSREQEELEAVDHEFHESLSYRIGSLLCPHFLL